MKKDLMVSGVYIAAVIGAGFASGAEIVHYFAKYHNFGFGACIISSVLFGIMAWFILSISKEQQCSNFSQFTKTIFTERVASIINVITIIFMMCVFTAMITGSGETISELTGKSKIVGVLVVLVFTGIVLLFDIRGLMAANGIMSVAIIVGVIGVCAYILNFREISVFKNNSEWIESGVVYTGYNILTAGAVLPAMSKYVVNEKRVGIICGTIIFLLISALLGIISIYYNKIPLGAIPMLTICRRHGLWLGIVYAVVLFAAMITTALANGFAVFDVFGGNKYIKIGLIVSGGFFLSGFSLDFFVGIVYRYAGYIGCFCMIFTFLKKNKKNKIVRKIKKKEEK